MASAALRAVAEDHLGHWRRAVSCVADGGAALVVSSGGSIESVLVAALTDADHTAWGSVLHQLDGATLVFDGPICVSLTINRLS